MTRQRSTRGNGNTKIFVQRRQTKKQAKYLKKYEQKGAMKLQDLKMKDQDLKK